MKMKAILALSGYGDKTVRTLSFVEHIKKLSEKENPKVVFLPTGGFDDFSLDAEAYQDFLDLGCYVNVLKLSQYEKGDETLAKIIASADIIYAKGGNLQRIMDEFNRTGAGELIKERYEQGAVLAGISSGAMCWFDRGYDSCGLEGSYMFVKCLGLMPFCFSPHFNGGTWYTFAEAVKQQRFPGLAAEDGAAIEFKDGKYRPVKEMEDRNVYLFDPATEYTKENIIADDRLNDLAKVWGTK